MASNSSSQPPENPYSAIAKRNVFALKDPPPPPAPFAPPPSRPPPNLVLTGIADFSTVKWAFVTRTDPGQPPKKHTLSPGEGEDGLQLLALDANHDSATVLVDGSERVTLRLVAPTNPPAKVAVPAQFSAVGRPVYSRLR